MGYREKGQGVTWIHGAKATGVISGKLKKGAGRYMDTLEANAFGVMFNIQPPGNQWPNLIFTNPESEFDPLPTVPDKFQIQKPDERRGLHDRRSRDWR